MSHLHHSGLTDEEASDVEADPSQRSLLRNQAPNPIQSPPIKEQEEVNQTQRASKRYDEKPERRHRATGASNSQSSTTSSYPTTSQPYTPALPPPTPVHLNEEVACWNIRTSFFNVLCVSLAFCLLFTAFNTIQSYVTSLLPDGLGNISLTICYSTVVLVVIFAPATVNQLGEPLSMTLGACCYCCYMASLISLSPLLLLGCSVILGFGGSILWVASGSYLTRCSDEHERGRNTGIFWAVFQSSAVIGNLSAYFIFRLVTSTQLFIIFCVIGCLGASVLLCLKPLPDRYYASETFSKQTRTAATVAQERSSEQQQENTAVGVVSSRDHHTVDGLDGLNSRAEEGTVDDDDQDQLRNRDAISPSSTASATLPPSLPLLAATVVPPPLSVAAPSVSSLVREVFSLFLSRPIQLLCPLFFFAGMEYSFWNGEFPQMLPKESIGLVLAVAGVMEVVGGTSLGVVSDRFGKTITLCIGSVVYAIGLYTVSTHLTFQSGGTVKPDWMSIRAYAYFAAGCFGLGDSAFNTQIYALLGQHYSTRGTIAFTALNFVQNVGMATGFGYQLRYPLHGSTGTLTQVYCQFLLLVLATCGFIACERTFAKQKALSSLAQASSKTTSIQ